jgi:uncharacterized protein (DUF1501 family)
MTLSRRSFLKRSGLLAVSVAGAKIGFQVFTPSGSRADALTLPTSGVLPLGTPILVVIDAQGGNDAANMLINPNDPWYYDVNQGHGSIAIPESTVLPLAGSNFALHPSMPWLASQWSSPGNVAFVLGSGENVKNEFSHFAAMYYRNAADFSGDVATGWLGRYNDVVGPSSPFASVSLTGVHPALVGAVTPVLTVTDVAYFDFSVNWQWEAGFLPAWQTMGADGSVAGTMLQAAAQNVADTFTAQSVVAATLNSAYDSGFGSGIGHELAQAAMLIEAGFPSQTYVATLSGFDTHGSEAATQAGLLSSLDTALQSFFGVVGAGPRAKDVFVLVTSEFGRQQTANASAGCDHGQAGVNILVGGGVSGGLYGQAPLTDPAHRLDDALIPTVDFRSVYATVLNRLSGDRGTSAAVLGQAFPDLGVFAGAGTSPSTTTSVPGSTTTTRGSTTTTLPETTTTGPKTTTTMPKTTTTAPKTTTTVPRSTTTVPKTTTTTRPRRHRR